MSLLETFDPESLCPFCQVIRLPQSRHCNICNQCVERYDHHCPWVGNCVGRTNHSSFYLHLILIVIYCVASLINAFMSTVKDDADSISDAVVYVNIPSALETISVMTLLTFGFLFGTLVTVLFIYQT